MNTTNPFSRKAILFAAGGAVIAVALLVYFFVFKNDATPKPNETEARPAEAPTKIASGVRFREDGILNFVGKDGNVVKTISVEIADEDKERTQGLMGRSSMQEDEGMLFVFPEATERSFWMANTPLPLDIIYLDQGRTVVRIHENTTPYSSESLPSEKPAQYVVEVNAGFCSKYGVAEGTTVSWLAK